MEGGGHNSSPWPRLALKNAKLQLPTSGPRLEVMHPALCAARPAPHELRHRKLLKFGDCTTGTPPLDGLHICATTTTTTTNFLVIINVGHMTFHFFRLSKTHTQTRSTTSKKALEGKSPSNIDSDNLSSFRRGAVDEALSKSKEIIWGCPSCAVPEFPEFPVPQFV